MNTMSQGVTHPIPQDGRSNLPLLEQWHGPIMQPVLNDQCQKTLTNFVRNASNFDSLSSSGMLLALPRLILHGAPGTGKSTTAIHMSSSLGRPFLTVRLASVVSPYAGETVKNIREIFSYASSTGCIIVFDEIDVLASARSTNGEFGSDVIVSSFIQELDTSYPNTTIIATTNKFDLLSPAVLHRFPVQVEIKYPDQEMRERLWRMFYKWAQNSGEATFLAAISDGFSGADIKNIACSALVYDGHSGAIDFMSPLYVIRALAKSSTNRCEPCRLDLINMSDIKPIGIFLEKHEIDRDRISRILGISTEELNKHLPQDKDTSSIG